MTHKNGCWNHLPFVTTQKMQDGHFNDGVERTGRLVSVPFRMARDCPYSIDPLVGSKDPACIGCIHKQTIKGAV